MVAKIALCNLRQFFFVDQRSVIVTSAIQALLREEHVFSRQVRPAVGVK